MSNQQVITELLSDGYTTVGASKLFGRSAELMSGEVLYDGGYRACGAEEMFGDASTVGLSLPVEGAAPSLASEPLFGALLIIAIVTYLYMFLRSWTFIRSTWSSVMSRSSERDMIYEGGELPLYRFRVGATIFGLIIIALATVRCAEIVLTDSVQMYESVAAIAPLIVIIMMIIFVAWQYALHKIVGWVTRSSVVSDIALVSLSSFVRSVVILFPIIAVWLVAPASTLKMWSIFTILGVGVMLLFYFKDTFLLFMGKKIPILYWILYLCTAILLPISFMVVILPTHLV